MANPSTIRRTIIILLDAVTVIAALWVACGLRFDYPIPHRFIRMAVSATPIVLGTHFISAYIFSLYRGIYNFSSFSDLIRITKAMSVSAVISALLILITLRASYPKSILLLQPMLAFFGICAIRFGIRLIKSRTRLKGMSFADTKNVLLVGAGELGESLVRQMQKSPELGYSVVGFIDDNDDKWGLQIHGCTVLGGRQKLPEVLEKFDVDEIVISIASRRGDLVRALMDSLQHIRPRPEVRIAPALDEIFRSNSKDVSIRKVRPADLLNRSEKRLDESKISRMLERKCVLVTGAGGTIGSELCRQALRYQPEKIILLENHATSLFYRDNELKKLSRGTAVVSILGDIRDQAMLDRLFSEHKPNIVLHAAAHKHVHQLEFNIPEGIINNILGTFYVAQAAAKHKADTFLLVSTDKAVKPSCIMGATKQVAEHVVRHFSASGSNTCFTAVRFGNVLGSSGSVLKIFEDQIAHGGPVTVTDERATRYFMTVEESVGLILQAVAMAKGGEIFVLKMGTPVKIIDMAKNLITLSGLELKKDITIEFTGLKQGEKLDEELTEDPAGILDSEHPDIHVVDSRKDSPTEEFQKRISEIEILSRGSDVSAMLRKLQVLAPTFTPAPTQKIPNSGNSRSN